ncbi:MAG: N-acetylmuramoyl-L-alanine amidase [Solirubrobacteraceae bacterium]
MTRRSLLFAGAGALTGAALRPGRALALVGSRPEAAIGAIELGTVRAPGRTLALARGVLVVGLQWLAPATARPQVRVRLADGSWGPWVSAAGHGHGPEADTSRPAGRGDPLWTGGARELQLRCGQTLQGARLRLVAGAAVPAEGAQSAALALAGPVLDAGPGQPAIIARESWARGMAPPRLAPGYGAVELGFVHHTDNPNGYSAAQVPAMLRAIYAFHRYVNGWNDIGYNFVIDLYGRIFEARAGGIDEPVVGAQAGGYNLVSSGVAVLGSFSATPISRPARAALERLLAWKLSLHGTPAMGRVTVRVNPAGAAYSRYPANARVSLPRIAGHRDADSTECPGDALYAELPAIRRAARRLAGEPVLATLATAPAPTPAEGVPASPPQAPMLLAGLRQLDGTAVAGAPVLVQARTVSRRGESVLESTVAEGVTDGQGQCSISAGFAAGASGPLWVRALYAGAAGHGAAVSPALQVAPLPAVTPLAASGPSS